MPIERHSRHDSCQHINARGHHCRLPAVPQPKDSAGEAQPHLCAYHAAQQNTDAAAPDPETVARELLRGVGALSDASSVNRFLGNLLRQVARRRIPRHDAVALAYISQLLINTLSPLQKERDELRDAEAGRLLLQHVAFVRENANRDQDLSGASSDTPS